MVLGAGTDTQRFTVVPNASCSTDDLALVLLEVDDGPATQTENGQARNVLGSGGVVARERRDILVRDLRFEFRPRELRVESKVSSRS